MKQERHIKIVNDRSEVMYSTVEYEDAGSMWKLKLSYPLSPAIEVSGEDVFDCLIEARRILEGKRIQMLCNAARKDVYPSRMSRQMSGGTKAYVMKLGKPAMREDLSTPA